MIAILCALSGIVAFALPVPGIIARFQDEQENETNKKLEGEDISEGHDF